MHCDRATFHGDALMVKGEDAWCFEVIFRTQILWFSGFMFSLGSVDALKASNILIDEPVNFRSSFHFGPTIPELLSLVGFSEHDFYFSIQLGMSSSQLTFIIFFRGVLKPTTNHIYIYIETIIYKPSKDIKASNQLCNSTVLVKNISWSTPLIWLAAIHGAGTLRCPAQRRKHHLEGGFWSKILGDLWMNSQRW